MQNPDYLQTDFDEENRILHVSYRRRIHPGNAQQLNLIFTDFAALLDRYIDGGRFYLIIDMTNFIVEPQLKSDYAANARKICSRYIKPNGVARYGYQITRITVRSGYNQYLGESPNIFNSREEALSYIHSLIEREKGLTPVSTSITTDDCADC